MGIQKNTPSIVTSNLLIYLDAANQVSYTSGSTTWRNLGTPRTAGINGTLNGSPQFSTANQGSLLLNGTNQFISLGNNTTTIVTGSFSIGFIGYFFSTASATTGTVQTLYGKQNAGGYGADSNGTPDGVACYVYIAGGYLILTDPINNYRDRQYFYHVMTYDSTAGILRMYRDGKMVQSGSKAGAITNAGVPALIGANPETTGQIWYLSGSVAIYQHYGRTLTDREVMQNYNAYKTRFNLP